MCCLIFHLILFSRHHSRGSPSGRRKSDGARAQLRHNANRFDHRGTPNPAQPCLLDDRHRSGVCAVLGHILPGWRHRQVIMMVGAIALHMMFIGIARILRPLPMYIC